MSRIDRHTGGPKYQNSVREIGANSDEGTESPNSNSRSYEINANSAMNRQLTVHHSSFGTRSHARERCYLFTKGRFAYGERCRYAHVVGNIGESGAGNVRLNPIQRSGERINLCQYFVGGRHCPYGDNCRFLHEYAGENRCNPGSGVHRESSAIYIATSYGDESKILQSQSSNSPHGNADLPRFGKLNSSKISSTFKTGFGVHQKLQQHKKGCLFKRADIKKISEVYADWIDNLHALPVSSTKDGK
ncbi:unnamed protein product [Cuscuta campestris]|uniref:C3H1-type domain-containing protein n=1 Tax=Cuscuta campestris TaxID=132261 RepID=A0A484MEF7_9ASTE|nr:unnamed protein product [Cuscuta campestris]